MISFENVTKLFNGKTAVSDISLNIPEGENVGIIGSSGAGKTTLIKLACGLLEPTSGRVRTMTKEPVKNRKKLIQEIGVFIAGKSFLNKNETVEENFNMLKYMFGISTAQFKRDYNEFAHRLGFSEYENKLVSELSAGQRMRAEIGAFLINRPRLLLLDEPALGLDANAKNTFFEILSEKSREGVTGFISSHDTAQISASCTRFAFLKEGRLLYYGSEEQLHKKFAPIDKMTLKIIGNLPDLEDLPLKEYVIKDDVLTLAYDANHITAAEILRLILGQTEASEIKVLKSNLTDIVLRSEI